MSFTNNQISKQLAKLIAQNTTPIFQKGITQSAGVGKEIPVTVGGKTVKALSYNVNSPGEVTVFWDNTNKRYVVWKEVTNGLTRSTRLSYRKTRSVPERVEYPFVIIMEDNDTKTLVKAGDSSPVILKTSNQPDAANINLDYTFIAGLLKPESKRNSMFLFLPDYENDFVRIYQSPTNIVIKNYENPSFYSNSDVFTINGESPPTYPTINTYTDNSTITFGNVFSNELVGTQLVTNVEVGDGIVQNSSGRVKTYSSNGSTTTDTEEYFYSDGSTRWKEDTVQTVATATKMTQQPVQTYTAINVSLDETTTSYFTNDYSDNQTANYNTYSSQLEKRNTVFVKYLSGFYIACPGYGEAFGQSGTIGLPGGVAAAPSNYTLSPPVEEERVVTLGDCSTTVIDIISEVVSSTPEGDGTEEISSSVTYSETSSSGSGINSISGFNLAVARTNIRNKSGTYSGYPIVYDISDIVASEGGSCNLLYDSTILAIYQIQTQSPLKNIKKSKKQTDLQKNEEVYNTGDVGDIKIYIENKNVDIAHESIGFVNTTIANLTSVANSASFNQIDRSYIDENVLWNTKVKDIVYNIAYSSFLGTTTYSNITYSLFTNPRLSIIPGTIVDFFSQVDKKWLHFEGVLNLTSNLQYYNHFTNSFQLSNHNITGFSVTNLNYITTLNYFPKKGNTVITKNDYTRFVVTELLSNDSTTNINLYKYKDKIRVSLADTGAETLKSVKDNDKKRYADVYEFDGDKFIRIGNKYGAYYGTKLEEISENNIQNNFKICFYG